MKQTRRLSSAEFFKTLTKTSVLNQIICNLASKSCMKPDNDFESHSYQDNGFTVLPLELNTTRNEL